MKAAHFLSNVMILALTGFVLGGNIHFFAEKSCGGIAQYEEADVSCGACINSPDDSGAAWVESVSSRRRVTVHALGNCTEDSITVEVR